MIGCHVAEDLKPVYQEIGHLLGISFNWLDNTTRESSALSQAVLVDGINLGDVPGNPFVLICGPVSGENKRLTKIKTLPWELGRVTKRLLTKGKVYQEADEPELEIMLSEVKRILNSAVQGWLEIPSVPESSPYFLVLTHDIDILSLREMPIGRTFLGFFYRSSVVNFRRWRQRKVTTKEFFVALGEIARTVLAKVHVGRDCWEKALTKLIELEKKLGVRSSLYFMPASGKAGVAPTGANAPANRASFYEVRAYSKLLRLLETEGWETGVHGIDAWHDSQSAREEYLAVAETSGTENLGVRMHWLYFQAPASWQYLEKAGFLYDSTFGFNEKVGFRSGLLQPFQPLDCKRVWELPLHIQDGALLAEEHGDLTREQAYEVALPLLGFARRYGGALSLLWHNQSFTAPRFWGEVYEKLVKQALLDHAWNATPREVLAWFARRRTAGLRVYQDGIKVYLEYRQVKPIEKTPMTLPGFRLRWHMPAEKIKEANAKFLDYGEYVEFSVPADVEKLTIEVKLKEVG